MPTRFASTPIPHIPASDDRLRAMRLCLDRTREYDPDAFYELRYFVRERLTPDERRRFDAITTEEQPG